MPPNRNPQTLFHLVPVNSEAIDLLHREQNRKHVSPSCDGGLLGLEVGYHVQKQTSATIITRVGRNADLILFNPKASRVHVDFQFYPCTSNIMMRVQRPRSTDVHILELNEEENHRKLVTDISALSYGYNYALSIRGYEFRVVWCLPDAALRKAKAQDEYEAARNATTFLNTSRRDTVIDKGEEESGYLLRMRTHQSNPIKEDVQSRQLIGGGAFGSVYKTLDLSNSHVMAVKVISIQDGSPAQVEAQRKHIRKEVDMLQKSPHPHIVELLHVTTLFGRQVCLYMPWRDGSLSWLLSQPSTRRTAELTDQVLHHSLMALDFLACKNIAHRDLKPDNILCTVLDKENGEYRFQLADFGLSLYHGSPAQQAGTLGYVAPEIVANMEQGSKVDIWALGMTLIWLKNYHPERARRWPFPGLNVHADIILAVRSNDYYPDYEALYREDQYERASAAQCLNHYFAGAGRTTMDCIAPIRPRQRPGAVPDTATPVQTPPRMKRGRPQQPRRAPSPVNAGPSRCPHRQGAARKGVPDQKEKRPMEAAPPSERVTSEQVTCDGSDVIMGGMEEGYYLRSRRKRG
ncbi:Protein kinase-like domain [Cordyceps militaris CM01]|uniref:mitogen-activated protein kinase n=1 Tax=Cordyceps militaris (strain CM01) TaxID=983644 RepID=G3JAN6_CORMM|nr:Protein kinase-like domain [Cordyceps militaris CM01]EGX95151.1 Protein kinase-like domain [Cordyceps militaris CM01]